MTQEEKSLLLQELCARLPYGVVYHRNDGANIKLNAIDVERGLLNYTDDIDERECKPYLRPMESMTVKEFSTIHARSCLMPPSHNANNVRIVNYGQLDFLNSHHFDYRGLIPMGIALPATEDMYNIE